MHSSDNWLFWATRKFASQPPSYLPKRLWAVASKRLVDRVFPTSSMLRNAQLIDVGSTSNQGTEARVRRALARRWHWSEEQRESIVRSIPAARQDKTIRQAEEIVRGAFCFRGRAARTITPGQWHARDLPIAWTWDLNRHHWFSTLGFAHAYSQDDRFLAAFIDYSSDWMRSNLHQLGRTPWDTPFEVASRVNAWTWAHYLFLPSGKWPVAHYRRFVSGLGLLSEYLSRTLEFHCPGNHILLEAKALALVGEVFPEFRGSARWRNLGWKILAAELERQICNDGVHAERCTMYHRIVAGELAELLAYCRRNDVARAVLLAPLVTRMAEFQSWLDQGGGDLPLFGDSYSNDTYFRFSAPAIAGKTLQRRETILESEPCDHSYWVCGAMPDPTKLDALPSRDTTAKAFVDGGYYVARSGWAPESDVLVWDCGPVGYQINLKHAHLDCLSFTLSVGGMPMLIDPGVHEDVRGKTPSRSTLVHNTISIDGEEQGVLAQRGEIWSPPRPRNELWASSSTCAMMVGAHDGYRRLRDPASTTRMIVAMHGVYWLVVDTINGSGRHLIEQRLHVAPGSNIATDNDMRGAIIARNGHRLALRWASVAFDDACAPPGTYPALSIEDSCAELECGVPERTSIIRSTVTAHGSLKLAFVCRAGPEKIDIEWETDGSRRNWLLLSGPGFKHRILTGVTDGVVTALPGGWRTDATVVVVREGIAMSGGDIVVPAIAGIWNPNLAVDYRGDCDDSAGALRVIAYDPGTAVATLPR